MTRLGMALLLLQPLAAQITPCDVNHDGVVNIVDVQNAVNQALGLSACTVDLDGDGKCAVADLQRVIVAALGGACSSSTPNTLTITAPPSNGTISGSYTFSVATSNSPRTSSVEYRIGSLSLGVATSRPFSLPWNTGYASDGNYSVEAIAYDATGNVISTAKTVVNINNHSGQITVNSPDLSSTLSGTVTLSITGTDPGSYYPARWNVFLDGEELFAAWTDNTGQRTSTITPQIDTTHVPNGKHEIHIQVASNYWPAGQQDNKSWYDNRLSLSRTITIDNGHALMSVATNYQHVYLQPGGSLVVQCKQVFTDNTAGPCSAPAYSSSAPLTVGVDLSGKITAGSAEGFSQITLSDSGKTTDIYVWVKNNPNIPHFSGSGQMLETYQTGSSIFPVAPFFLDPSDLQSNSALAAETKRAGINTLSRGFYMNPRSITQDYGGWQSDYDGSAGVDWTWAKNNGYHFYTMGDEIARNIGGEAWWTLNWPYGQQAAQHAMQSLAASGIAIAIDIIDEGSSMWGPTPTPPRKVGEQGMFTSITCSGASCTVTWPNNPVVSGRQFALTGSSNAGLNTPLGQIFLAANVTNTTFAFAPAAPVTGTFTAANDPNLEFLWWAGSFGCPTSPCNPPVPNTALASIAQWLRSATPHVPISWPALGIAPPIVHDNWAGKDSQVSDFMSHYWDSLQAGRTYSWGSGIAERTHWMRNAFYSRQVYANLSRPQIILDSISSFWYEKQTPGAAYYNPPQDVLVIPGTCPGATSAGIMTAAAIGNAGVRLYLFEKPGDEIGRAQAPVGSQYQTGASPTADENSRNIWKAISYASNVLTKTAQPFILGKAISSPWLGRNIVTAARQSTNGIFLMAVNANDWERSLTVDLTPYRAGTAITKYVVGAAGIRTALVPDTTSDTVTLRAGETAIWLFPSSSATSYLSSVPILAPALPAGGASAILHQGYIYSQDLNYQIAGTECTAGCSLTVDRTIGDLYYQFVFVASDGTVVGTSAVNTIPGN